MLRKSLGDVKGQSDKRGAKRNRGHKLPLGSKKPKSSNEKELESLVLGGQEQLIEALENSEKSGTLTRKQKVKKPKPAWQDDDDDQGSIQLSTDRKFAGIKHGDEKKITKKEYGHRLKTEFQKVSSTPTWAKLPSERDKNKSDGKNNHCDDLIYEWSTSPITVSCGKAVSTDDDSDVEDLLQKTGTFLTSSASLPRGILNIKSCTDINKESPLKGMVKSLEFHPSAQVALTGGMNNTLSLFQVDGKTNPKIQSFFIENFPIHCAHFSKDGEQVVMGSRHKSFKYLDMIAGKIVNIPIKGVEERCMMNFEVSPDGKYLVFLGEYGRMHFISSKSKEWLFSLQMNGGVSSIAFTNDGQQMFSHGDESQVYVWDLRSRECVHRFMDDGCTHGTTIAVSPNNQYVACGSNTGVVNLYERDTCVSTFTPKPLKAIMNLTSSCDITKFNPTSEMLAIASREDDKAIKLVHIASQTVFSNFPDRMDSKLKVPTSLDFSVNSGYFTVGTSKGKALLYRLKHYGNY